MTTLPAPGRARPPVLAYACLALGMAVVGSYVGLARMLVATMPIFVLSWLRFAIAAVAMLPWTRPPTGAPAVGSPTHRLLLLMSLFGNFLFSACMLGGMRTATATDAAIVFAAIPAAVAVLSAAWLGERLSTRVIAGIGCAVAGIAIAGWASSPAGGAHPGASSWHGRMLLLGAVGCEAAYVVIGKRLTDTLSPKRLSAWLNLWGLALTTPFALWQWRGFALAGITLATWGWIVYYALAASVLSVWLWTTGLRRVPAATAGVYTVMLPVTAAAVGVGFLGETPGPAQTGAYLLALAGVMLATWAPRGRPSGGRPTSAPPEPSG